ncbi:response regulator transcription factor [Microbispora sp. H10836]|uniref:helix-turn-helix transcriptional regulator n=1 Tax=Microbispora sp. H10836 TaxID=2729106 RepID=UPI0014742DDC|nr:response regulator transcription factor [Microbispora sp. H10836]
MDRAWAGHRAPPEIERFATDPAGAPAETVRAAGGAGRPARPDPRGYLTKDAGRAQIAAALRATVSGQSAFGPAISRRLVRAMLRPDPPGARADRWSNPDRLTPREVEVLALIAQGMDNARIAASLFIGETTVKTHINNAFAKIGARNRSDATRYACRHGLAGEDQAP